MGNPLNVLYDAVGWVVRQIYAGLSPVFGPSSGWTWALTIIILVVAMRLVMVPLFIKQMHTTRAMTSLQPQMAALRKRYKNDKQTLNQETMKLYQEAGVNPLMGCLPVVAQLPLFFSLFSVLKAIAEWKPGDTPKYGFTLKMVESAKEAKILGVNIADKVLFTHGLHVPLHSKIVIFLAVVISMTTTFLTVRQSQKRGMMPAATPDNPMGQSQKYMAYIMPFFALTGLYWPFGLVLYWVTTNLWTLLQQWALFKRYPYTPPSMDGTPAVVAAPAIAPRGTSAMRRAASVRPAGTKPGQNGAATANGTPRAGGAARPGGTARPSGGARPGTTAGAKGTVGAKAGPAPKAGAGTNGSNGSGSAGANGAAGAKSPAGSNGTGASGTASSRTASSGTVSNRTASNGTAAKPAGGSASSARKAAPGGGSARAAAKPVAGAKAGGASAGTSSASALGGAAGMLRKLGRGRAEPEPVVVEEPEVKVVRQQPQRQSRSKRSGKH